MDFKTTKLKNTLIGEYYGLFKSLPPLKKSVKASYAIARTLGKLREPVEKYEEERRKLFSLHFGENAGEANPKLPGWPQFQKDLRELNNLAIPVEYMKFEPSDLADEAAVELTPDQINATFWMTEDPPKEDKPA